VLEHLGSWGLGLYADAAGRTKPAFDLRSHSRASISGAAEGSPLVHATDQATF
jgi:hypothetical protein